MRRYVRKWLGSSPRCGRSEAKAIENGIIGAGSLIGMGKKIPPGSLAVGSPARVIRKLDEEDFDHIRGFAARYVALQNRYRAGALKSV